MQFVFHAGLTQVTELILLVLSKVIQHWAENSCRHFWLDRCCMRKLGAADAEQQLEFFNDSGHYQLDPDEAWVAHSSEQ